MSCCLKRVWVALSVVFAATTASAFQVAAPRTTRTPAPFLLSVSGRHHYSSSSRPSSAAVAAPLWRSVAHALATTTTLHRPSTNLVGIPPPAWSSLSSSSFALYMSDNGALAVGGDDEATPTPPPPDPLIVDSAETLGRVSWLSWWAQVILTVISSVTLLFARNVISSNTNTSSFGPGFVLAGTGLVTSAVSIFWTWGAARLSRRLKRTTTAATTSRTSAANMIRRAIRVGCTTNLVGMAATLAGAQQIVGALAIKVLTQSGIQVTAYGQMPSQLQPLDILVVQANTNTLLSHFCSLVGFLWLTKFVAKLDPPSTDANPRAKRG